jgi:hypothetical protein
MWYSTVGCIVTLTLSLFAASLAAEAQQGKVPRIGVLLPFGTAAPGGGRSLHSSQLGHPCDSRSDPLR